MKIKKSVLAVILSFVLVLSTFTVSFAWFANVWSGGENIIDLITGKNPVPEMFMYTYTSGADSGNSDFNAKGSWKEIIPTGDDDSYLTPGIVRTQIEAADGSSVYNFTMENLQFGVIDNLISLKEDNAVYVKVKISVKDHGKGLIRIQLQGDKNGDKNGILSEIYTKHGGPNNQNNEWDKLNIMTDTAANSGKTLNTAVTEIDHTKGIFMYTGVISTQNITPTADNTEIEKLFEGKPLYNAVDLSSLPAAETGQPNEILKNQPDIEPMKETDASGTPILNDTVTDYYLYLKIVPNLKTFGDFAAIMGDKMPCIVLFNLKFSVSILS